MTEYVTYTDNGIKFFVTKEEAVQFVEQYESGEVRRMDDDIQVFVKFPKTVWV